MTELRADLLEQKSQLIAYCQSKLSAGDWHAVQDAATDIREINAKLEAIDQVIQRNTVIVASASTGA